MGKNKIGQSLLKRKKLLLVLLSLILICGIIFAVVKSLNAPSEGTISQVPLSKAEIHDPYSNAGNYTGKYVSFTYPAHYKKLSSQITGNYLEVLNYSSTDGASKHITVGVLKENLNDDSGIKYRSSHPELYKEEPETRSYTRYTSTTGHERIAYLSSGGMVATVSVTSSTTTDLANDLQTVLSSFSWN